MEIINDLVFLFLYVSFWFLYWNSSKDKLRKF